MQPIRINLAVIVPSHSRIPLWALYLAALVLVLATVYHGMLFRQNTRLVHDYRQKIASLDAKLSSPAPANAGTGPAGADAAQDPEAIRETARAVNRLIIADRFPWDSLLDVLEKAVPPGMILESILPSRDLFHITLKGRAHDGEAVVMLLTHLAETGAFPRNRLLEIGTATDRTDPGTSHPIRFIVQSDLMPAALVPPPLAASMRQFFGDHPE